MKFTIELCTPGSPVPVAVMHECTEYAFKDADGKRIVCAGLNAILREEQV